MTVVRIHLLRLFGLVFGLLLASIASTDVRAQSPDLARDAADTSRMTARPTVVLVHGAFADGSSWQRVIPLLQARGFPVVAVQNPLSSLADDAAAVTRAINQQPGSVILVGHSWGGAVITQAGVNAKVAALVYVAAFALEAGQSINTLLQGLPPAPWLAELRQDEGGFLTLSARGMSRYFAPDLPAREASLLAATEGPWFAGCLGDTLTQAAWHGKPSWWVLAEEDRMIDPLLQQGMAAQINANVIKVRAGHTVLLSHPHRVVEAILQAARLSD